MAGTKFDLKPCQSRSTRLDRSSQLISVDPKALMYLIQRRASRVLNSCIRFGT